MTDREKLVELVAKANRDFWVYCDGVRPCSKCRYGRSATCRDGFAADQLIANGVTFATDNNDGSKWISAAERLPDNEDEDVLILLRWGTIDFGFVRNGKWRNSDFDRFDRGEVTHWMPLPTPPEGEREHE